jgi:choline-glycine betaine transporter
MLKQMKPRKVKIIISVLAFCLVLTTGFIVFDKYQEKNQQEQFNIFQRGAQYGYEQAVIQIFQQASTCQQVPINVGNQTMNIIDVKCLQKFRE